MAKRSMAIATGRGPLARQAAAVDDRLALHRAALWVLLAAKLLTGWGVQWDIQWHVLIGRDTFWIAPHLMTYAGVTLAGLVSFGLLGWDTLRGGPPAGGIRIAGLVSTRGVHLAAWGMALTGLAAPIDDLWHRLFGLDVTLWSPPHLLGIAGGVVNSLGVLLLASELYPAGPWRLAALLLGATTLYRGLHHTVEPATLTAYVRGGAFFFSLAILSALVLPAALIPISRLAGRWAPLAVLVLVIVTGVIGLEIAHIGFQALQPVSVIDEEIAREPGSPIALATAIARKNGSEPGQVGGLLHLVSALPILLFCVIDGRRRPLSATVAYAAALCLTTAWALGHTRAFAPLVPGATDTALALVLALGAALGGGYLGNRLAEALARDATVAAPR
jgi:hypothetical protein